MNSADSIRTGSSRARSLDESKMCAESWNSSWKDLIKGRTGAAVIKINLTCPLTINGEAVIKLYSIWSADVWRK